VIHHSHTGHFAYRYGKWKLLLARSSGGWSSPTEKEAKSEPLEAQLYDMENDVGETNNLYAKNPETAERLLVLLAADVNAGRSTKGPKSMNDIADIVLWKNGRE
jgi:hypothetical protein